MKIFSYKLDHDYGLAPNPFGKYCTLAVCKSSIRKNRNIEIGDWVIGTGSARLGNLYHLIYAMKVEEKLTTQGYWDDERFAYKKPQVNGSLAQMYGDNMYHRDPENENWIQENGAHSSEDGTANCEHMDRDVGGEFVLISSQFYYLGDASIEIPEKFQAVCTKGRDMMWKKIPEEVKPDFILWITQNFSIGIHGDPISWKEHITGEDGKNEPQ